MTKHEYLIIGGGMTGDAAVKGIRQVDANGSIALIGSDPNPPYKRPPLTKALWKGKPIDSVWLKTEGQGVDLVLDRNVVALDLTKNVATDDRGATYEFNKLLLATGVRPRTLPFGQDQIIAFRTIDDYRRLRKLTEEKKRIAVIGGGFIGSEVAASLAMNGAKVTMAFPEDGIGSRLFPADLSLFLNDYYREKGVDVLTGEKITGLNETGDQLGVRLHHATTGLEQEIEVDGIVAGLGAEPNVDLARSAGVVVDNGIVVDEFLRTNHPNVFSAGDVTSYPDQALGERRRVEHEDNAKSMGRRAGRNMAGQVEPYTHLPFFYSDLFDLGYEAVGEVDARHETFEDWKVPMKEGVVYYLKEGKVRGVLLWNVWDQVNAATALIAKGERVHPADLKGRLPEKS